MCRVNTCKIRQPSIHNEFWILNPIQNAISPNRILMKKIENSSLLENKIKYTQTPIDYIMKAINSNDFSFYEFLKSPIFGNIFLFNCNYINKAIKNEFSVLKYI